MVDLTSYKKADLLEVAHKVDLSVNSKDTKKSLIEKLEAYISEAGSEGEALIEASLDAEDESADEDDASTLAEKKEDDEEDEEYKGPPINVVKYLDPVIKIYEEYYAKVLDFTDSVGITTLEYNEELRENLSKTVTLNYIEFLLEAVYFLQLYVPLVAVKNNALVPSFLKEQIPALGKCNFPLPDLSYLVTFKTLSITFNWAIGGIVIPLFFSYYFNFTRRSLIIDDETSVSLRIYKYDPFIFALTKLLTFYFVVSSSRPFISLNSYFGFFKALEAHVLIQFGYVKEFYHLLGNFPLILGFANVLVGIYAQFEDF